MRSEGYSSCLVCLSVCLSAHTILAVRAIKKYNERYCCVKRQICSNIKMAFFLKLSYSKVRAFFIYLGRGGHLAFNYYFRLAHVLHVALSGFANVYIRTIIPIESFSASINLYCYRHCGCPACVCS